MNILPVLKPPRLLANRLILAAFSVAGLANAEPSPPVQSNGDTIIVTGEKLEKKVIRRQASSFAGVMIAPVTGQYSRRIEPICAQVFGIDKAFNKIIYSKIKNIVETVGEKYIDNNCTTNLSIIFAESGIGLINLMRKQSARNFLQVPFGERSAFFKQPAPARWWYMSELEDPYGIKIAAEEGRAGRLPPYIYSQSSAQALIDSTIKVNMMGSAIVIDLNLAKGYPLESIAAYAAMVSLVQIKNGATFESVPSILNMFAPGRTAADAPNDLTRWDYAFVKSLYEVKPRKSGTAQKVELAHKIAVKLTQ